MKKIVFLVIACFWLSVPGLAVSGSSPGDWTGNFNLFLGAKALDKYEWEPTEEQDEYGVEVDFKQVGWPVSIAIDLLSGSGEGIYLGDKFESKTSEFNVGVRKIWDIFPRVRPFIGGGISFITGEFIGLGISDDDSAAGIWIGGGVYWTLGGHFNIGLEGKYSTADVTLFGINADAGGGHFGMLLGFHW